MLSEPREHILALVSGLPRGERERCYLVMLQVHVDDSGSSQSDEVFVLGGLIASVDQWLAFTDAWKASLDRDDLAYFKTTEARMMEGEFSRGKGWNRGLIDQKIDELAAVAAEHAQYSIHVTMRWADFNAHVKVATDSSAVLGPEWNNPYFICFYTLAARFARFLNDSKMNVDREFIFDEQGAVGKRAAEIVAGLQSNPIISQGFGGIPSFRNDKKVRPLQAADLYAWNVHDYVARGEIVPSNLISAKRTLFSLPSIRFAIRGDILADLRANLFANAIMQETLYRQHGLEPPER
jgi:hypothetical protein